MTSSWPMVPTSSQVVGGVSGSRPASSKAAVLMMKAVTLNSLGMP